MAKMHLTSSDLGASACEEGKARTLCGLDRATYVSHTSVYQPHVRATASRLCLEVCARCLPAPSAPEAAHG